MCLEELDLAHDGHDGRFMCDVAMVVWTWRARLCFVGSGDGVRPVSVSELRRSVFVRPLSNVKMCSLDFYSGIAGVHQGGQDQDYRLLRFSFFMDN